MIETVLRASFLFWLNFIRRSLCEKVHDSCSDMYLRPPFPAVFLFELQIRMRSNGPHLDFFRHLETTFEYLLALGIFFSNFH